MSYKSPNIISAEDLVDCTRWALPEMDGDGRILPSAEKELKDQAARDAEVIEEVESDEELTFSPITAEELQAITDQAEKEGFEQGKVDGLEQGLKEGREQGYQQGLEQAQQQSAETLEKQVSQLLQVAEALANPIGQQQAQLESLLLNYVTRLTRQVIERELIQDSSHILSVVKQAMAALPVGAEKISLTLNPDDLALVEAYSEEHSHNWHFRGDSELLPGGCRIETDESMVDFSVESKLDAMFAQFLDRQLMDPERNEPLPEIIPEEQQFSTDLDSTEKMEDEAAAFQAEGDAGFEVEEPGAETSDPEDPSSESLDAVNNEREISSPHDIEGTNSPDTPEPEL